MGWAEYHSGDREFRVPDDYPLKASGWRVDDEGRKYIRVKGVRWYTNIDISQRHTPLDLRGNYYAENESHYPHFDNFDAINVDKVSDIPCDYEGVMGVPITFFDKYCPEQFDVLGYSAKDMGVECLKFYENMEQSLRGADFIRNTKSARFSPMILSNVRPSGTCYRASNVDGYLIKTYGRVFIRRKDVTRD